MDWMNVYHALPYPFKTLVVSLRGYQLKWWRYDRNTEALVQQTLERETWSRERWKVWQEERLAYILHRAATQVPYYREYWQQRRRAGDKASWEMLENWPVLKKEEIRKCPRAFVAEDCNPDRMYHLHTSGSTGTPLDLWQSCETLKQWYALFEARWRKWYGLSRHDRWAIVGGRLIKPVSHMKPPFWVWNAGLHQLYMSAYHLNPEHADAYLLAMRRHHVRYLWGYASGLYTLAWGALEKGLETPDISIVISNAEPLYDFQRSTIKHAFGCPVRDTYGMCEIVCATSECEAGHLHLWPEVGVLEVMDDKTDQMVSPGNSGRLICTGLLNADMPLIRYEVGDRGARDISKPAKCKCGRTLPILRNIEGRIDDVIVTPDGRHVGRLSTVFKGDIAIREAQVIQERIDLLRIRVVPAEGYSRQDQEAIAHRLHARVGDIELAFETLPRIPRGANGKFKVVISRLNEEER